MNRRYTNLVSKIDGVLTRNVEKINKLQQINQQKQCCNSKDGMDAMEDPNIKLIKLQTQFRLQNESNQYLKCCIQA